MTLQDASDLLELTESLSSSDASACCTSLYASPAVRWVLGDELHPGGAATTRQALEMIGAGPGQRLLDVAAGSGDAAILAAREFGCEVTGIDHSVAAINDAEREAEAARVGGHVTFHLADADSLRFDDGSFDAVLCECSLGLFADKRTALSEIRRVLRPEGCFALADVLAAPGSRPICPSGPLSAAACIDTALSRAELRSLLDVAGFGVIAERPCTREAAQMAERVHDRLRGARILATGQPGLKRLLTEAIALVLAAREAIDRGALDYAIFAATRRESSGGDDELSPEVA